MPDYRMNINGQLGLSEYSNIFDYMSLVDTNDNFTITLDNVEKDNINIITSMLKDSKFSIVEEGIDTDGKYHINVNKIE
ncbi:MULTISPECIES: hypothetical protein [unclassified Clostridium]|uniref:hypothetical protein n=1 Tax=unclassified Clostridium TaxID=2614128 RepID=UPI0025C673DD|nr:hypothetical protein [Clostridium sp.]MCI6693616.1 hypothetical protein [Clostridium sp.]MDY2632295.1 hypothetical protein [Clostridium sp.]MDY4253315.1 hypothetical protein [Clostridium sp.]MDY6226355.1 hypothetical protein [Clostridium sp.]